MPVAMGSARSQAEAYVALPPSASAPIPESNMYSTMASTGGAMSGMPDRLLTDAERIKIASRGIDPDLKIRDTIVGRVTPGNKQWWVDPNNNPEPPKTTTPPSPKTYVRPPGSPPGPPGTVPRPPAQVPKTPPTYVRPPGSPVGPPGTVPRPPVMNMPPAAAAVLTPLTITVGSGAVIIYVIVNGATEASIGGSCKAAASAEMSTYLASAMQSLNPDQTDNIEACLQFKTDPAVSCTDEKPAFCTNPSALANQVIQKLNGIAAEIEEDVGFGRDCAMEITNENNPQLIGQLMNQITQFCSAQEDQACAMGKPFLDASGKPIDIIDSQMADFCENHPGSLFTRVITMGEFVQRTPHTCPCK